VICGAVQKCLKWTKSLDNPEDAKKPQFRYLGKAKSKAKGKARPAEVAIVRRISVASSAGQSPHHGLQDDVWGARGAAAAGRRLLYPPTSRLTFQSLRSRDRLRSQATPTSASTGRCWSCLRQENQRRRKMTRTLAEAGRW